MANLRASIYYYENVADADEDLERKANIDAMAKKLKDIVVKIENEIASEWSPHELHVTLLTY